jgi:uncharacterized protein YndB with AHSA1/START domain
MERVTGQTKDVGFEIGVSRTLPHPPEAVWAFLTSAEGVALWLGPGATLEPSRGAPYETANGTVGEVRGYRELDRVRVTSKPAASPNESTVQFTVRPSATGTSVRFHQERLTDAEERERRREHWGSVLDQVAAALAERDR